MSPYGGLTVALALVTLGLGVAAWRLPSARLS